MQDVIRILVLAALAAIVYSLGSALFYLSRGGDSEKLVRALTFRIGLSLILFALLMLGWYAGIIVPHGGPVP